MATLGLIHILAIINKRFPIIRGFFSIAINFLYKNINNDKVKCKYFFVVNVFTNVNSRRVEFHSNEPGI